MSRPRGFAPWSPRSDTLQLVQAINAILHEYQEQLPLTIRQVFYIAVTRFLIGKTERDYSRLCETLNRARRAMLVPMDSFRDDGFTQQDAEGWDSADHFIGYIKLWVDEFTLDRQAGQDSRLIVWCEAQGMVPQLKRVADDYSVPVFSSGGFDSLTSKHSVAKRLSEAGDDVEVLHVGDHDPSGVHMLSSLDEDISAFISHYSGAVKFTRLAVTPEQVKQYQLPTAPAKPTDRRKFDGLTTQCEALDPVTLASIIRNGIESRQHEKTRQDVIDREQAIRDSLRTRLLKTA